MRLEPREKLELAARLDEARMSLFVEAADPCYTEAERKRFGKVIETLDKTAILIGNKAWDLVDDERRSIPDRGPRS
jgi:hypothetical protein